ncbi:uncharacterized protein C8Q71DRAFT_721148 [Rhodofomes roseus]|uniref:Uncharacterized protein n=1 Tax=Rhodofomes roseus TaxID=34475 RepID=A0ABQ8KPU5_9APHY|nr:uncharacterized protein C8Q71DRAFT_721148 [Rhodofomes roseus]KAH9840636.1 hypothetical protein C8Q71DRAFT_721148 [Rhodofomes roseus]
MASTEQELMQLLAYTCARIKQFRPKGLYEYFAAMLVYDCLTGTSREVELIWTRKIKATNCLFKLSLFANSFHDPQLATLEQRLSLQMAVIPTAFGVLRVYAVIDRDWRTTLFTLILGLFPTAIDILYFAKSTFAVLPLPDGHLSSNTITVKCASFDVFVISVLWSKCRQAWKTSLIARRQHSLTEHLLKDVVEPPQSTTDLDGINLDLLFTPTSIQDQESAIAGEGSIRNMPTRSASSRGTGLPVNMVDLQGHAHQVGPSRGCSIDLLYNNNCRTGKMRPWLLARPGRQ